MRKIIDGGWLSSLVRRNGTCGRPESNTDRSNTASADRNVDYDSEFMSEHLSR